MSRRLELLQLRKEALALRAELERIDLAQHLADLRRPSEVVYKGLKLVSLLRMPLAALLASRLGKGSDGKTGGAFAHLARYAGYALAGWRLYRGARELMVPPRRPLA